MSYYLADSQGLLTEFANVHTYGELCAWAKSAPYPALSHFAQSGYTFSPEELFAELGTVVIPSVPPDLMEPLVVLRHLAFDAKDVLIVTEGESEGDEELRASSSNALHRIEDKHEPKVLVAVQYAFAMGRKALKTGDEESAAVAVSKALKSTLAKSLVSAFSEGAMVGVSHVQRSAELRSLEDEASLGFDMSLEDFNPSAVEWAKKHVGKLIKGISETTRDDIKSAIAKATELGTLKESFDTILDAVGNEARAQLIARTETMTAVNEGQRQAWSDAVEQGYLSEKSRRVWIAADGCCDDCDDLDGEEADLDGEYPNDGGDGPPLHPNCRCTEGIASA